MAIEGKDNGQVDVKDIFPGIDLSEIGDVEKFETGADHQTIQQKLGVLQTAIHAPTNEKEYRQLLYLGNFRDEKQAMRYANVLALCRRYNSKTAEQYFLDRCAARCGIEANRLKDVLLAMNSYNHSYHASGGKTPFWRKKKQSNSLVD